MYFYKLAQYTSIDAGYSSTDFVLSQLLMREDCRWIPDMILTLLDSRNFAEQSKYDIPPGITVNIFTPGH